MSVVDVDGALACMFGPKDGFDELAGMVWSLSKDSEVVLLRGKGAHLGTVCLEVYYKAYVQVFISMADEQEVIGELPDEAVDEILAQSVRFFHEIDEGKRDA